MGVIQDIRYSVRLLLKTPLTTIIAVLSLALGIGANTAIFSLINALILKPLAISDPQSLVSIRASRPGTPDSEGHISLPMFEELQRNQKVFSSMFLWDDGGVDNLEVNGVLSVGSVTSVTGDFFSTLGVPPVLGRLITKADTDSADGSTAQVAVLDFRFWKSRYGGDPKVVGKTIRVNGTPVVVIGVMPESFHGLIAETAADAIAPFGFSRNDKYRNPASISFSGMGRLKPGVTIQQARAELETLWPAVRAAALPPAFQGQQRSEYMERRIHVEPCATGNSFLRKRMTRPLKLLMALVVLVLIIACMNLANLMLARAAARRHEIAIRAALGSGLWRIARQLVIEGLVLSSAGAVCGLAMAVWASGTLLQTVWSGYVPLVMDSHPDMRVLAFTALIAIATGVAFSLAPVWNVSRMEALGLRTRSVRAGIGRFGEILVSSQIALSFVLLVGATLFARSLGNLYDQNPGFRRDGILLVQLFSNPGVKKIPNRTAYFRDLVEQLTRIPGVRSASYSNMGPVSSYDYKVPAGPRDGNTTVPAVMEVVGPDFFNLIDMHVLAGRQFSWNDDENGRRVVVVSASLAWQLFPGRSAVGERIKIGTSSEHRDLEIVGVVNSANLWMTQSHEPPAFFLPLLQENSGFDDLMVDLRVDGDPLRVAPSARGVLAALGKQYALKIETVGQRLDRTLISERLIAVLSGFFGVLALLLAVIGLYGVMSLAVTARTSEIGLRMALGAQRGNVIGLILRRVLWTTAVGLAVGVPVSLGLSRFEQTLVFGLTVRDPGTLILAGAVLLAAALVAGYMPARYAAGIDPIEALRID